MWSCLVSTASGAIITQLLLEMNSVMATHRTRAHIGNKGLRGSPTGHIPTHHPTYPDWGYIYESTATYPTSYPTYSSAFPTFYPDNDDRVTNHPTADQNVDNEGRELPNKSRETSNRPTHHPTYPDWGYMYESSSSNRFPTTFPTYSDDHDTIEVSRPISSPTSRRSNTPTVFDWNYNSPTYMPSSHEEVGHKTCEVGTFFQLDIALDYDGHDLLWKLIKLPDEILYQGNGYKDGLVYDDVAEGCLLPGSYEFTIYDSGGDGLKDPGYYSLKLCKGNCQIVAAGHDFGYNETTAFTILEDGEPATRPPSREYTLAPAVLHASSEDTTSSRDTFVDPSETTDSSGENTYVDPFEIIMNHSHENWVKIIDEDFENGFGFFVDQDTTAVLYDTFEGRSGVVGIQEGNSQSNSAVVSKTIRLGHDIGDGKVHSKFKVVFSYYAHEMESNDSFCFEHSTDGGSTWHTEQCWTKDVDYENETWYDDVSVIFEPENVNKLLTLRFRCNANSSTDSVMIDNVQLSDLHD